MNHENKGRHTIYLEVKAAERIWRVRAEILPVATTPSDTRVADIVRAIRQILGGAANNLVSKEVEHPTMVARSPP